MTEQAESEELTDELKALINSQDQNDAPDVSEPVEE